ncbi:formate/nitrite transporter family protein [Oerskovia flava]|uniref:formate/nitrite transporter family protein n=1 Tax=Oerskovia flava TaxID=2986422 RepID=UPI00223EC2E9|nr:formate/nitrite transporter family protein [Oerskovia sp. JB1-3-2]
MLSLRATLTEQSHAAQGKVAAATHPARYLVASMLAGAYIGIGVVLMVATAGPFLAAGDPAERLVAGAVFAVALTLVVFAGAELSTSAMMILTQGVVTRAVRVPGAVGTLLFCFVGNLLGSMVFAFAVVQSGVLRSNAAAGEMVTTMLAAKAHEGPGELFFRGVLCNVLVCVAIWACTRLRSEVARAIVIFWAIFAFIASGFEHVVANMTTFGLGLFAGEGATTIAELGRNLLWVGLGNLVGGAVVVGLGYALVAGGTGEGSRTAAPATDPSSLVD